MASLDSATALKANSPKLIATDASWSRSNRPREILKALFGVISHIRRYGFLWVPEALDTWEYRAHLRMLDWVCLRALKTEGALTAVEMAAWLDRKKLLRTRPEKTGIYSVSEATVRDWFVSACRRDLVIAWPQAEGNSGETAPGDCRWALSENGSSTIRSRLPAIRARIPDILAKGVASLAVGGTGLAAAASLVERYEDILVTSIIALVYLGGLGGFIHRLRRRESPGLAVVIIETVRARESTSTPAPLSADGT